MTETTLERSDLSVAQLEDLAYELQYDFRVRLDWRPYPLDIPSCLGPATVKPNIRPRG